MVGRRYRMPPANGVIVLLATVAGVIACVAVVIAVAFATRIAAAQRDIQLSRIENTRTVCEEQNARHDNTIAQLDALLDAARKDPATSQARLKRIKASRASTVSLIAALAPRQNCNRLIRERFGSDATPTGLK